MAGFTVPTPPRIIDVVKSSRSLVAIPSVESALSILSRGKPPPACAAMVYHNTIDLQYSYSAVLVGASLSDQSRDWPQPVNLLLPLTEGSGCGSPPEALRDERSQ